ncbi:MAG: DUF2851 family protein [Chloroflexi bacterium]|jgi:hypothetical protein|nr:DUF2851 family protein [Chloroflexota bacterium]
MSAVAVKRPPTFVLNETKPPAYGITEKRPAFPNILKESNHKYDPSKKTLGPEAILHKAWRNAGLERAQVRGRDGHTYKIVYGGKPGGSLGPDFTDAVVERDDGVVFRGDIEIHVRESDWRAHGHHADTRYNGVVLHVVALASGSDSRQAVKATGATIPLLALNWKSESKRTSNGFERANENSHQPQDDPAPLPKLLLDVSAAGLERFHAQAAGIALDIEAFGVDQAIWLGVLGALGYPRNKRAFRAVGGRVDWLVACKCQTAQELEQLLLYASGLHIDDDVESSRIRRMPIRGSAPDWVRPWGRPANAPHGRIKAISELVFTWSEQGGIASAAEQMVKKSSKPKDLSIMFRPPELVENENMAVIGASRAAEIVVNVTLPAVFAMATSPSDRRPEDTHLKNRALQLYSAHPKLATNSITKEAVIALGLDYELPSISSARDQQGLISLYREMFRHGIRDRQPRLPGV